MKPKVDALDALVFFLCAAYSAFLQAAGNKERFEPDYIWAEVAVGNLIILVSGAALRVRLQRAAGDIPTWRDYESAVMRAFVVGGSPVIVWQVLLASHRHEQARLYLGGDDELRAEEVAEGR